METSATSCTSPDPSPMQQAERDLGHMSEKLIVLIIQLLIELAKKQKEN